MATYIANSISGIYQYINGLHGGPQATAGDIVYISGGSLIANAQPTIPPLYPNPGVSILKYGSTNPILIANQKVLTVQVTGDGSAIWLNNPIIFSGISFFATNASGTMDIGDYGWYSFKGCNAKIYGGTYTGKSSAQSKNCFTAEASSGKPVYVELYNVTMGQAGADLISTKTDVNDGVPDAQQSYIKAYDCFFTSPGQKHNGATQASTDQLITSHEGVPIYIYGGRLENGIIAAGADGYHFIYFADIDGDYVPVGSSGQTSPKDIKDTFVTFGNFINHKGTITGNTVDGTSAGRSWVAGAGHSKIRDYALVRDNYIIWNGRSVGNEGVFHNTNTTVSGGNYAIINNMVLQSGGFTGDNFLVRQYPGAIPVITGIVHSNIIVGTSASNGTQGIKMAETYVSGGPIFINHVYNNASIAGKSLIAYVSATIPSGQGSTTYASNNFQTAGSFFDNASLDNSWGYVFLSGNLSTNSHTNLNAPLFTTFRDNFSTNASLSGTRFNYYPTPNGNLDFGSGVTPQIIKALDGAGEASFGTNYRGAKSRQLYNQTIFPSFVM